MEQPRTRGIPSDNWVTPFNSFNSFKYLMWRQHMEAIVAQDYRWHPEEYCNYNSDILESIQKLSEKYDGFLPPYMVDLDPSNICNYDCSFCNSKMLRRQNNGVLPEEHLLKIADFLKEWGVQSSCISGGGEPLFNPSFSSLLYRLKENGIKNGVITNGSLLDDDKAVAILKTSSWCGLSIDAGSKETFSRLKNVKPEMFDIVINNLRKLVEMKKELKSNTEITFKFLLHPYNAHEIFKAVMNAKFIGVDTFHLRPVCWDNLYNQTHDAPLVFSGVMETINNQVEQAQNVETDNFKFFGIRHKFGERFERKVTFKRCLATPMMTTFGADGNVHNCFDVRGRPDWVLCRHYPNVREILDVWGSEKHRKILESIDPSKCPRCTFLSLCEIIEQVIIEDKMFKDFL